ncbi:MAG: hypothetical protein AAF531_03615 [Actinomycetota bacterium]
MTATGGQASGGGGVYEEPKYPSLRERKPLMYWTVIIAVAAMVLTTVGSVALAFA